MIQSEGKWRRFPEKFQHMCEETALSEENSESDGTRRSECRAASSLRLPRACAGSGVLGEGGPLVPTVEPRPERLQLLHVTSSAAGLPAAAGLRGVRWPVA